MLELRPTCENCNKALPADSPEARICTLPAVLERCGFDLRVSEFMNPPTSGRDKGRYAIVARMTGTHSRARVKTPHETKLP